MLVRSLQALRVEFYSKKIVIGDDEITMPGDKIVKFKRASTATYINKSGQLKLAEVDEPRFERDGLLIEGQRTNYLRNSNKPDSWTVHSALNKTFGTDKQGFNYATVTPTESIVGTTGGYTVHGVVAADRFPLASGECFTFSCRVKGAKARCRLRVSVIIGGTDTFSADSYLDLDTRIATVSGNTSLRVEFYSKQITVGDDVIKMPSDKVVSFKRASGATYINKSGVLTVAEVDEPRFEREGLLIEGQRTNYHLNSLTPSKWGATTSVTITESGVDEFGFTYGRFQIKDEKIGTNTTMNIAAVSGGRGVDVTGTEKYVTTSCRVKSDSANIQCRIRFERYDGSAYFYLADAYLNITDMSIRKTGGGAARITARAEKESNGWIYFEVTYQSEAIDNMVGSQIQIAPPVSPGTYLGGEYLDVTTPQFEGGSCASSFIISDTVASTRASDIVTLPCKNNMASKPLTCMVEVNKNWSIAPNSAPRIYDITGFKTKDDAFVFAFRNTAGSVGTPYVQFGNPISFPPGNYPRKIIAVYRIKSDGKFQAGCNGVLSTPASTTWKSVSGATGIRIGGQTTAGLRHLFGYIRNFRIWHKELTDAQMGEII